MEQYNDAEDILEIEVKNNPMNLKAQYWLGVVYFEQGKSKNALKKFENVSEETDKFNEEIVQRLIKSAKSNNTFLYCAAAVKIDRNLAILAFNSFVLQGATTEEKERIKAVKIKYMYTFDYINEKIKIKIIFFCRLNIYFLQIILVDNRLIDPKITMPGFL